MDKMDDSNESNCSTTIYHEKQIKELCALHCLNNLFQNPKSFTKENLDEICLSLSPTNWINPHRSILGLGNYDINVIMTALQNKGYETIWFDKRKDPYLIIQNNIIGYILNIPSQFKLGKFISTPIKRRHWLTIRNICGCYYNLDSKLEHPEIIGTDKQLVDYLKNILSDNEKEMFVIVPIENSNTWFNNENNS